MIDLYIPAHMMIRRHTRRQILLLRPPVTLIPAERQLQYSAIQEEIVRQPILPIRLPIQRGALNIKILIPGIEIAIPHRRLLPCDGIGNTPFLEEGRRDKIDVLARVGEESHHGQRDEGSHSAAVVVAGDADERGVEEPRDVVVRSFCALPRPTRVVVLEHRQEALLVADVEKSAFVEVVEPLDELVGSA
ncbi:glycoside hydrolase family 92 protein [Hortaea werneckii]|nr:glycoside hydrolase family 92 protein [Hortaea werneckii]